VRKGMPIRNIYRQWDSQALIPFCAKIKKRRHPVRLVGVSSFLVR
jgi:hypothetical protein